MLEVFCGSMFKNTASSGSTSAVSTFHHAASIRQNFGREYVLRIYCHFWQYLEVKKLIASFGIMILYFPESELTFSDPEKAFIFYLERNDDMT